MNITKLLKLLAVAVATLSPLSALSDETTDAIEAGRTTIEAVLEPGVADAFHEVIAEGAGEAAVGLGHVMFARRHFDAAGWLFAIAANGNPDNGAALASYAAMVAELHADDPATFGDDFLNSGVLAAQAAVAIDPTSGAFQNNLSRVLLDAALTDEAVVAARAAVAAEPANTLYLSNLARALEAAGAVDEAASVMAQLQGEDPVGMSYLAALDRLRQNPGYSSAWAQSGPKCEVNYACQDICPKSIIGGLMSVTCEIENSNAQMACQAGNPYAPSYNCKEDLPEFGILIPGLNAGFSIAVPGASLHVLVQGDGSVDVRGEVGVSAGPISGYLRADGHYNSSNGVSVDNMGGGVRLSIVNGSRAGDLASGLGHPPAHIEMESLNGDPVVVGLEGYNVPVITN